MKQIIKILWQYTTGCIELWDDSNAIGQTGWIYNGDGTWTCDGTNNSRVQTVTSIANGIVARITFEIISISSGGVFPRIGGTNGTTESTVNIFTEDIISSGGSFSGLQSVSFIGTIKIHTIREVPCY